jgi:hypothetical protein
MPEQLLDEALLHRSVWARRHGEPTMAPRERVHATYRWVKQSAQGCGSGSGESAAGSARWIVHGTGHGAAAAAALMRA